MLNYFRSKHSSDVKSLVQQCAVKLSKNIRRSKIQNFKNQVEICLLKFRIKPFLPFSFLSCLFFIFVLFFLLLAFYLFLFVLVTS